MEKNSLATTVQGSLENYVIKSVNRVDCESSETKYFLARLSVKVKLKILTGQKFDNFRSSSKS